MRHNVLVCSRLIFVRPGGVVVASVGDEGTRFGVALEGLTEYFLAGRGRLQVVWLGRVLKAHQGNTVLARCFRMLARGDAWIPDLLRKSPPARSGTWMNGHGHGHRASSFSHAEPSPSERRPNKLQVASRTARPKTTRSRGGTGTRPPTASHRRQKEKTKSRRDTEARWECTRSEGR